VKSARIAIFDFRMNYVLVQKWLCSHNSKLKSSFIFNVAKIIAGEFWQNSDEHKLTTQDFTFQ